MKLEDIGFYTLEDKRAENTKIDSRLWRCELILTDLCNFKCPYCRGIEEENCGHLPWDKASFIVESWASHGLKNIRFSGGEPTLWKGGDGKNLIDLVALAKEKGIQRIAVSTNGSVSTNFYLKLVDAGVNDFSISLDACCAETGDLMAGNKKGSWQKVVKNIEVLSKLSYVTVGVVFTEENVKEFMDLVDFADKLGVSDIRILSSAQWNETFKEIHLPENILNKYPILKYRMNNYNSGRHVRGLKEEDSNVCPLVLDDMAILNGKHYPCIIYLREQGHPIGTVDYSLPPFKAMEKIRKERESWMLSNNVYQNKICKKNCLDVCIDYNNKVKSLNNFVPKEIKRKVIPIVIQNG